MFQASVAALRSSFSEAKPFSKAVARLPLRRAEHGGTGWVLQATASETELMYQPQDGVERLAARAGGSGRGLGLAGEAEDARLTGGTRSLMRRLSGLNLGVLQMPKRAVGVKASLRVARSA